MGYYMTVQLESLKANGVKKLPENVEYFEVDGEWVKPIEHYFKWDDSFEEELVFLARAGITGEIELMGEEGEYTKYKLKQGVVEVYEGKIVYPEKPNTVLGEPEP